MTNNSPFYNDDDWFKEKTSRDVITFTVRQRYDEALKICLTFLAIAVASLIMGIFIQTIISYQSNWKFLVLLLVILGVVMGFICLLCLIPAIVIRYQVKPESNIAIYPDRIDVRQGEKLLSYSLDEISHFYWRATDNELRQQTSNTTMIGIGPAGVLAVAAMSSAQNAGQLLSKTAGDILSANKAKVSINHRGQEKMLVERLSDEEAEFFFGRLKQVLRLTA